MTAPRMGGLAIPKPYRIDRDRPGNYPAMPGQMARDEKPAQMYRDPQDRLRCANGCGTLLSRYNPQTACSACAVTVTLAGGRVEDVIPDGRVERFRSGQMAT